jgi:predicted alpha/beta superfamily hydrolase
LQGEEFLPELIIVGIPNMNLGFRERDFTPTHVSGLSGGADKFLAFLKSELIPYIEKTYPAKADGNTLYGGSLAGLFVLIGRHAPQYGLLRSESLRYASDCR